jgi:4-diphosphocytidyl-2-C-methyl-D-erythritol kinase
VGAHYAALPRVARRASAKINLALHVTGQRPDGYHLLDSIAVFAELGDTIEVLSADHLSLSLAGRFSAHAPGDERDLAWRAALAFFSQTGIRPQGAIRVKKRIPAGAGLGGGSSDAAAVIRALDTLFATGLPEAELRAIGLPLGADVPMCVAGSALRARGIGEDIRLLDEWPSLPLVLVWPGLGISTASVFSTLERRDNPALPEPPAIDTPHEAAEFLLACRNDLEVPALALLPVIGEVLQALRSTEGCLLARMSGSGSACFAVYASDSEAIDAAATLARTRPAWWSVVTSAS